MKDLNRCARCGGILVTNETVHVVDGKLYCCRPCAIIGTAEALFHDDEAVIKYSQAYEQAKAYYDDCAEEVATESILSEDLCEVNVSVHFFRTIKMPRYWSKQDLLSKVEQLFADGKIIVGPEEFDEMRFECALVGDNSVH